MVRDLVKTAGGVDVEVEPPLSMSPGMISFRSSSREVSACSRASSFWLEVDGWVPSGFAVSPPSVSVLGSVCGATSG